MVQRDVAAVCDHAVDKFYLLRIDGELRIELRRLDPLRRGHRRDHIVEDVFAVDADDSKPPARTAKVF
ncbi:hypothetical protein SDC9_195455 [bioreactor metagenome]|uniref:Uncharacterized protein n=1 Tax=bioreactor metagenome TaxID=1076179 RepID=A0A645I950_9ZZZZ